MRGCKSSPVIYKGLLIACLFFYIPSSSMAWALLGHRIVGEIADKYLTRKAREEIKQILGNESIAMASNWADFIKSDTSFKYLWSWHFIDFDSGSNNTQILTYLRQDTAADAYTALNFLVTQLKKKNLSQDKKLMYLRLLIHIAGDVHQPFHVSEKGDNGGNGLKVSWFGISSNIHSVWDEQLIDYQKLSYTEYVNAINFAAPGQIQRWQKDPISQWLLESYNISLQLRKQLKQPEPKLSYLYNFNNLSTLNEQLLKAGVRLAGLLNTIFG